MKTPAQLVARYRKLREQPLWSLLAGDHAPVVVALLEQHLINEARTLAASTLHEKVGRDLVELRAQGEDLPRTAQSYIAEWVSNGFLERRFPAGAVEEEYELSAEALRAIRFVSALNVPRAAATASRLEAVIELLSSLAVETDPDPSSRVAALESEVAVLNEQIAAIRAGRLNPSPPERSLEKLLEGSSLSLELSEDLRQVRNQFEQLNRSLRERLLDTEGSRGDVLQAIFAGVDLIAESEPGQTFAALWRLLMDPEQSARLQDSINAVLSRPFSDGLPPKDRQALRRLSRSLLERGGAVHEVSQAFARSLKTFVQSREYREARRLHNVIAEAQRAVVEIKNEARPTELVGVTLTLSTGRIGSVSQLVLHDPDLHAPDEDMSRAESGAPDLAALAAMIQQADIDFRLLRANIEAVLALTGQASIAQVTRQFEPTQGLGSIVGYLHLGYRYGVAGEGAETVSWTGADGVRRATSIPRIFFLRENFNDHARV